MIFEIEFFCTDDRPLLPTEENYLVNYLKPLYNDNEIIVAPPKCYYRNIGILNTKQNSSRTYFKAGNSIKIPTFEKHRLSTPSMNYILFRKNHVRRHFSVDAYGVINRLKLAFDFTLNPKPRIKGKKIDEEKETYEIMKYLLENIEVIPSKEEKMSLRKLGEYLVKTIATSTVYNVPPKKGQETPNHIKHIGTTVVIVYQKGELAALPHNTKVFYINKKHSATDIFYYDFNVKENHEIIRFYFVQVQEEYCPESYFHQLKNKLLDLRSNLVCLESTIKKINLSTDRQENFLNYILEEINSIRNDTEYGFLNLANIDKGEILKSSNRKTIANRIRMLKKITIE